MNQIQIIKQRFGIIGTSPLIDKAISIAMQVAPTELTVLITGESGVGKEAFSHIIHSLSRRKHAQFIAINCGAIPEGTVDSELFGHLRGSFTNALEDRKGYFEVADNGTIFLDEVAELPLSTQARLLRVLENGEYLRVGSSKVHKTNVRILAATNDDLREAVKKNKFREDLYYRLSTVPLYIPPLRERREDIYSLFRKFMRDFQEKYNLPSLYLDEEAQALMKSYNWPGNVRQLKNITEQIVALEAGHSTTTLTAATISKYIPKAPVSLPSLLDNNATFDDPTIFMRDLLYKALFEIKKDVVDLKQQTREIIKCLREDKGRFLTNAEDINSNELAQSVDYNLSEPLIDSHKEEVETEPSINLGAQEENLSLSLKEKDLIQKALKKHNGKRRLAAQELGISERTLYRKLKDLNFIIE